MNDGMNPENLTDSNERKSMPGKTDIIESIDPSIQTNDIEQVNAVDDANTLAQTDNTEQIKIAKKTRKKTKTGQIEDNLISLFEIDIETLSKKYENTYKMLWEQILLLAIYARQYKRMQNFDTSRLSEDLEKIKNTVVDLLKVYKTNPINASDKQKAIHYFNLILELVNSQNKSSYKFLVSDLLAEPYLDDTENNSLTYVIKSIDKALEYLQTQNNDNNKIIKSTKAAIEALENTLINMVEKKLNDINEQKNIAKSVLERMKVIDIFQNKRKKLDEQLKSYISQKVHQRYIDEITSNINETNGLLFEVLRQLEANNSSNEILFYLQKQDSDIATKIRQEIETKMVIFGSVPPSNHLPFKEREYSYYSIAQILDHDILIQVFKKMLGLPSPDEGNLWIRDEVEHYITGEIKKTAERIYTKSFGVHPLNLKNHFIERVVEDNELTKVVHKLYSSQDWLSIAKYIKNSNLVIPSLSSQEKIESYFAEFIGQKSIPIFNLLTNPYYKENDNRYQQATDVFSNLFSINRSKNPISISIDKTLLSNIQNMGVIDELAKRIAYSLNNNNTCDEKIDNDQTLSAASNWYEQFKASTLSLEPKPPKEAESTTNVNESNSEVIKQPEEHKTKPTKPVEKIKIISFLRIDQIAKAIASIIEFDRRDNIKDAKQRYKATTEILSKNFSEIKLYIPDRHSNKVKYSNTMLSWVSDIKTTEQSEEENKIMNRFRKLNKYLKDDKSLFSFYEFQNFIQNQKRTANPRNPFPINTSLPLPLWVIRDNEKMYLETIIEKK